MVQLGTQESSITQGKIVALSNKNRFVNWTIFVFAELHSNGRLLALPSNIRLGWKCMEVTNTRAYYDTATITAVKSLTVQALGYFETFYGSICCCKLIS